MTAPVRLGLRENLGQFSLLVAVNALVGGLLGEERTVVPLLASRVFGITGYTTALTYIAAFGSGVETVVGRRIPSDRGFAGRVYSTGRPLQTDHLDPDDPHCTILCHQRRSPKCCVSGRRFS